MPRGLDFGDCDCPIQRAEEGAENIPADIGVCLGIIKTAGRVLEMWGDRQSWRGSEQGLLGLLQWRRSCARFTAAGLSDGPLGLFGRMSHPRWEVAGCFAFAGGNTARARCMGMSVAQFNGNHRARTHAQVRFVLG